MDQVKIERIDRYIRGESSETEQEYVESLFASGEEDHTLQNSIHKDWDKILTARAESGVDLNPVLDRIHHIIRKNEVLKSRRPYQRFLRLYIKAAAILLLPLIVAGGFAYSILGSRNRTVADKPVISSIYAPMGARVSFSLPDGTTGMLNSGSHLSYSMPFSENRQVRLEGEAWFEVFRDEDHPFQISSGNSTVKVLGTSFNLSAYPAENYVEVVLQEGKVEFTDNKDLNNVTVLPSERLVFKDGKTSKSVVDPAKYNAWTEGKLVFRGDPMAEVARRIERWYNVKVTLADRELEKYSFRATFEDDNLEDVIRFLCLTSPIRCKINPRQQMTDGSYTKKEVTFYRRK